MELWTSATPNGWKVSIMIEELIDAGAELGNTTVKHINLAKGEQHSPEFLARNSGLCCSPFARLMCFTVVLPNSAPASINSSIMMLTFQPFGVADVQSSIETP